jgi:hypothetical protein
MRKPISDKVKLAGDLMFFALSTLQQILIDNDSTNNAENLPNDLLYEISTILELNQGILDNTLCELSNLNNEIDVDVDEVINARVKQVFGHDCNNTFYCI